MKNNSQSILDNIVVAAPCSIPWESMKGNDTERSCSGCSRTVYNISDMTRREAEDFLAKNGASQCMRLHRRSDGTIMTDNCPRALRKVRDQCKVIGRVAAGICAFALSIPAAFGQSAPTALPNRWLTGKPVRNFDTTQYNPMNGGIRTFIPTEQPQTQTPPPKTTPPVETIIQTIEQILPNGKKVILVVPSSPGKVITIKNTTAPAFNNKNIDTRALEFYDKAQKSHAANNLPMAEFYFEKALDMFDKQKKGDDRFRQHIESELKNVRLQAQQDKDKASTKEPKSEEPSPREQPTAEDYLELN